MEFIRPTSADEDRVFQFLCENFYPDEPIGLSLNSPAPPDKYECITVEVLKKNLSILAVKKDDPSYICGLFLCKPWTKVEKDETWTVLAEKSEGTAMGKINEFLVFAGEMFHNHMTKRWEETQTDRALEIAIACVRRDCRGQKLGFRLIEKIEELAKENNFPWLMVECSSAYSAAMFGKAGFYSVDEMLYKDYKDDDGNIIFKTSPPHVKFSLMVKYLKS